LDDVEQRDDAEAKAGRGAEESVVGAFKKYPWSSSINDERLKKGAEPEIHRYDRNNLNLTTRTAAIKQEPQPTPPKGAVFHPLLQGREAVADEAVEFDGDVLPPTSHLLGQISTFSQNELFQAMSNDAPPNDSPFPFHPDAMFNTENIGQQLRQASIHDEEGIQQRPTRSAGHNQLQTTKNDIDHSQHKIQFDLNMFSDGRVVQTPHGLAILIPTQHLGMVDPQKIAATTAPTATTSTRKFQRWTEEEDDILKYAVSREGPPPHNWKRIAKKHFSNSRSSHQCKSRWTKVRR
jgi:hypothetical protein